MNITESMVFEGVPIIDGSGLIQTNLLNLLNTICLKIWGRYLQVKAWYGNFAEKAAQKEFREKEFSCSLPGIDEREETSELLILRFLTNPSIL